MVWVQIQSSQNKLEDPLEGTKVRILVNVIYVIECKIVSIIGKNGNKCAQACKLIAPLNFQLNSKWNLNGLN